VINGHSGTAQATISGTRLDADGDYIVNRIQVFDRDGSVILSKSYDDDESPHHPKVRVINVKATSAD
jgi:hypothetical protein